VTSGVTPGRTLLVADGVLPLDGGPVGNPPPRALLLDGDRIAWVGDPADAPATGVPRVDLDGCWITPAFVDAHVHGTATGLAATGLDLDGVGSLAAALAAVRRHAADRPGRVVRGLRWDDSTWPERRPPTARELEAAAPGRPVLLLRVDGHSCVVDPGTLARLPLDRLAGVDRDAAGEPTGWLLEEASQAARRLVDGALSAADLAAARRAAAQAAAGLGIATLHEMGHPGLSSLDDALAWAAGGLPVEVLVWWAELDADAGPRHGLRPGGDLFLDGSVGSGTAAVAQGYPGGGTGELFHDDDAVTAFFVGCTGAGRGAGVHAIGDRAIDQAVRALERAAEEHGAEAVRRCRHRIEHLELPRPDHLGRLARLGVVASVQPAFDDRWGGEGRLYALAFGDATARAMNPLAPLAAAGVALAFGSDSTVTPLDPWGGVVAAQEHRGGLGIDRVEALRAHTLGGRWAAAQDDVGPLRPGLRADLAVWDGDPLAGDPRRLRCAATVVAGRVAHDAGALGAADIPKVV
jgi:predicted amidohydrolase YtcJ